MKTNYNILFLPSFQHTDTHKHGNKEKMSFNTFSLLTCDFKKVVRNQNLYIKVILIDIKTDLCTM